MLLISFGIAEYPQHLRYMKILESSQTLLHVLKRETVNLDKKQHGYQSNPHGAGR